MQTKISPSKCFFANVISENIIIVAHYLGETCFCVLKRKL